MDHRYWPNARHMHHIPWVECLLCRLDNPTYGDLAGRTNTALLRITISISDTLTPVLIRLCESVAALVAPVDEDAP